MCYLGMPPPGGGGYTGVILALAWLVRLKFATNRGPSGGLPSRDSLMVRLATIRHLALHCETGLGTEGLDANASFVHFSRNFLLVECDGCSGALHLTGSCPSGFWKTAPDFQNNSAFFIRGE